MDAFIESLTRLPTAHEMQEWDKAAIAMGIPDTMLMENAARAIFQVVAAKFDSWHGKRVCLFMGGGNNGGDAACLARHLVDAGATATVFCQKNIEQLKGAAAFHARLAQADGVAFEMIATPVKPAQFLAAYAEQFGNYPDLLVDGLLGTGFLGSLKPEMAELIAAVNAIRDLAGASTLAIDIPSGLNSSSGRPRPVAICADWTVALAAAKPGLVLPCAQPYVGALDVVDIGIPRAAPKPARLRLLSLQSLLHLPQPPAQSYKNIYGHLFVFGGAQGYAGAAHLAAASALRAGCGLVTACAPAANLAQVKSGWPEIMTMPCGEGTDWPRELSCSLKFALTQATAIVIGPGMGRSDKARAFLHSILRVPQRPPAVIDADALALISRNADLWPLITAGDILTPHPGEAAMLLQCAPAAVQQDRHKALDDLCALAPATFVLKGAGTLVGQGAETRLLCPYDVPQLAIGGAGDCLAGAAGALLGSRIYARFASAARAGIAVMLHAAAGLALAQKYPRRGATASELANLLARACVQEQPQCGGKSCSA